MTRANSQLHSNVKEVIALATKLEGCFDEVLSGEMSNLVKNFIHSVWRRINHIILDEKSETPVINTDVPADLVTEMQELMTTLSALMLQYVKVQEKVSLQPAQTRDYMPKIMPPNPKILAKFEQNYKAQNGPDNVLWTTVTHAFRKAEFQDSLKAIQRPFLVIRRKWIFDDATIGGMANFKKEVQEMYGLSFGNMTPVLYERICQKKQVLGKSPDVAIVEGARVIDTRALESSSENLENADQSTEFKTLDLASLDVYWDCNHWPKKLLADFWTRQDYLLLFLKLIIMDRL